MLQGSVKKTDLKLYINQKVTGITITEFTFSLLFGFNKQLDVTTHWELVDITDNKIIDRGMALKLREQMILFKVIGANLITYNKDPFLIELFFDNKLKIMVY